MRFVKIRNIQWALSLKWRLIISFALIVSFFGFVSLFNWQQLMKINDQISSQNSENNRKLLALELKLKVNEMETIKSALLLSKNLDYIETYNTNRVVFEDYVKKVADTASNSEERKMSARLINVSGEYTATFDSAVILLKSTSMPPAELSKQLESNFNLSKVHRDYIFELIGNFYNAYSKEADSAIAKSTQMIDRTVRLSFAAVIVVLLATLIIAFLLTRSFTRPIIRLQKAVALIARGDLRHTINSNAKDELGQLSQSFDHMTLQVREMLENTQKIASSLSEHSQSFHSFSQTTAVANSDILKAINEISAGADEQAAQSERSAQLISDLELEIRGISEYTDTMLLTSEQAAANTEKGIKAVHALHIGAEQSQDVLSKVHSAMDTLAASSKQISKIIDTITEISTQTNVLSLNAAIEAARAGVQGRGFSIIAEEVRMLSQQTNESSKTIGKMIHELQLHIRRLQEGMVETGALTHSQNAKIADTLHAFDGIRTSMNGMIEQMNQIHRKTDQVRMKNEQLVQSVQHVAAIAEETAAGVEEVNSTSIEQNSSIKRIAEEADDIYGLSQQLFDEISKFQIAEAEDKNEA